MEANFYYNLIVKKVVNEDKLLIHKKLGELDGCFRLYTFYDVFRVHKTNDLFDCSILINNSNWDVSFNLQNYDYPEISYTSLNDNELTNKICNLDEDGDDYEDVKQEVVVVHAGDEYKLEEFLNPLKDLSFNELYDLNKSEVKGELVKVEVENNSNVIEFTKDNLDDFRKIKFI